MPPISGRMSLLAGLLCGLLLILQMAQVAHARGDTCDESKCRSPGLTNVDGQGYGYDCWANEYGPLSPWNSPYEAYACADDYAGHWIRNGTENYQYYTCCKTGSTPTQEGNELFDASWHSTRHVYNMNVAIILHDALCSTSIPLHYTLSLKSAIIAS
jgi:hypothetical protein